MKRFISLAVFMAAFFCLPVFGQATTTVRTNAYASPPAVLYPTSNATKSVPLISGNPPLFFVNTASNTAELVSHERPLPTVGTFSVSSIDIFETGGVATWAALDILRQLKVNLASFTASLPSGGNTIGSIGAIVNPLPTGGNTIGSIGAIINPLPAGGNTIGSATALPPDGASFPVNLIDEYRLPVASTTVGTFTTAAYSIPLVPGAREIMITLADVDATAWIRLGGDDPTVGNGIPLRRWIRIDNLHASEVIKVIASTTYSACWTQR